MSVEEAQNQIKVWEPSAIHESCTESWHKCKIKGDGAYLMN